jgi:hypothetical protein
VTVDSQIGDGTWPFHEFKPFEFKSSHKPYPTGNSVPPEKIAFENALIFFTEWARPESGGVDSDILQQLKDQK